MKRLSTVGMTVGAAIVLGLIPAPALALSSPADELEGTLAVLDEFGGLDVAAEEALAALVEEPATVVDGIAVADTAITELPSADDPSIEYSTLDGAATMSIDLPGVSAVDSTDDAVTLGGASDESFVVQATEDGGVQILNIATTKVDSHSFDVDTTVPEGSQWVATESGSLELREADGTTIAAVDVPWAVDASGDQLPTYFSIEGGRITQHVDTRGAAFPVVSDPDIWWVIGTAAMCAVEIAGISMAAVKVVSVFAKADKLIKSTKSVVSAYNALGGKVDKVINLLKKYVKSKTSLTKSQISSLEKLIRAVGLTLFGWLGLGNCYSLITGK